LGGWHRHRDSSKGKFKGSSFRRWKEQLLTSDLLFGHPVASSLQLPFWSRCPALSLHAQMLSPCVSPLRAFATACFRRYLLSSRTEITSVQVCDCLPLSIRHVLVGPLVRFGPYSCVLNGQKSVHVTRRKPSQRATEACQRANPQLCSTSTNC
jgi:hypothetical protein